MQPESSQANHARDEVILSVEDLWVTYQARRGTVKAVRGVSFELHRGETLAFIGESGCGKTTLGLALIRLLPASARVPRGKIVHWCDGLPCEVLTMDERALREFRWRACAMIFQSALNAFNPVLRVWDQVLDTAQAHGEGNPQVVRQRMLELFRLVQLDPERVMRSYPHELSGGMRQRVLLALGLLLGPQLIILDEPTTALDILTQRSVIEVLRSLRSELDFSLILISHDLSLAAELADRVGTMYAGALVEVASVWDAYYRPHHPYTMGLIRAVPTISGARQDLISIPGTPPDLIDLPPGCTFHPRCPYATAICQKEEPRLEAVGVNHQVACWNWQEAVRDQGARLAVETGI
jgi:peptide/nickel transport system ATP-binding protein